MSEPLDYGYFDIVLAEYLLERQISKNKLAEEAKLEDETSGRFFRYFFSTWLKEQGLRQPDSVDTALGNTFSRYPTFEVYDRDFVDESSKIEIYVPVTRK